MDLTVSCHITAQLAAIPLPPIISLLVLAWKRKGRPDSAATRKATPRPMEALPPPDRKAQPNAGVRERTATQPSRSVLEA